MAIIKQKSLFVYEEVEGLGDLERLQLVLSVLPDSQLIEKLQRRRDKGRKDHSVVAMWNSVIAGIVYQHPAIESLRRELSRNGQLRHMCGLRSVPSSAAYTRFLHSLLSVSPLIEEMFNELVTRCRELLPDFGRYTAIDSKAIPSVGQRKSKRTTVDCRGEHDADRGKKHYHGIDENGKSWEKIVSWFGFKLHLIVDSRYELPLAYEISTASASDVVEGRKLVKQAAYLHPALFSTDEAYQRYMSGDKGYDDTKFHEMLHAFGIVPILDIRNMWKDGHPYRWLEGYRSLGYDYQGTIYCYPKLSEQPVALSYVGYERERDTIRYQCPHSAYGIECPRHKTCSYRKGVRIKRSLNPRLFNQLPRSSYKWEREYKRRTAVERVNSRLDVSFGFEHHTIRGQEKMKLRVGLALVVMLALAVGRIEQKQPERMRSLVG